MTICPQLMKTAGFHGEGYVELDSRPLRKNATLGFTFKTAVPNGLLLLSTFASKVCQTSSLRYTWCWCFWSEL